VQHIARDYTKVECKAALVAFQYILQSYNPLNGDA
jgi:hypothetical protein